MSMCKYCGGSIRIITGLCRQYANSGQQQGLFAFAKCEQCGKTSKDHVTNNIRAVMNGETYTLEQAAADALQKLTVPRGGSMAAIRTH